ncbi:MAG: GNAT family N-acetyltransferase [Prolixibacteraceae bacterium]|jgi:putative acetyltransferase|nr:GNAT family N-acetyltransferase [Prolixibacteraceae bacterium]
MNAVSTLISVRKAGVADISEMKKMAIDSIAHVCKNEYNTEQIETWISLVDNVELWRRRIHNQYFIAAEIGGEIVGLASIRNSNYLDFLYVHKNYQRLGIASKLYAELVKSIDPSCSSKLEADVSKTALSFFLRKGFRVTVENRHSFSGVEIINYRMILNIK